MIAAAAAAIALRDLAARVGTDGHRSREDLRTVSGPAVAESSSAAS